MNKMLAGSLSGFVATVPMSAFMVGSHALLRRGEQHPLPPRHITKKIAQDTGALEHMSHKQLREVTWLNHFAYGASVGAIYGMLSPRVGAARAPLLSGMGYGLAVWAGSYLGWLPALKILPSATRESIGRNIVMIAAHLVWGAALGALCSRRVS